MTNGGESSALAFFNDGMASLNFRPSRSTQPSSMTGRSMSDRARRLPRLLLRRPVVALEHQRRARGRSGSGATAGPAPMARLPSAIDSSSRPWKRQRQTELIVREGVVGIERDRAPEFALAARPVVFVEQLEDGERRVRFGGIVVELDRLFGRRLRLGPRFAWRSGTPRCSRPRDRRPTVRSMPVRSPGSA